MHKSKGFEGAPAGGGLIPYFSTLNSCHVAILISPNVPASLHQKNRSEPHCILLGKFMVPNKYYPHTKAVIISRMHSLS